MFVLPIVARELLVLARRKSTYAVRVAASAVAGLLTLWLMIASAAAVPMEEQGRTLFASLSVMSFAYCLLVGAIITADCLSIEKRNETLGFLFLTDLRGHDVVLGKLVSASLQAVYGLLGVIPVMALALLMGGVTGGEIGRMALVLGNTLFLSLSVGMFVSTVSHHERKALFAAAVLLLVISGGPFGFALMLDTYGYVNLRSDANHWLEILRRFSPVFAFLNVRTTSTADFYQSLLAVQLLAWLLLIFACVVIPRIWQTRAPSRRAQSWKTWWRDRRLGDQRFRRLFRGRLLERNPCYWLSSRERLKPGLVWLLVMPLVTIVVTVGLWYPIAAAESSLLLLLSAHLLLKIWLATEICSRWVEDRQCGALELLACSPLSVRDLIYGQTLALRRQFLWPAAVVFIATLATAWVARHGFDYILDRRPTRLWIFLSLPVFAADLIAIRWVAMWVALTAAGLNRAILRTVAIVISLRWILYLALATGSFLWDWLGLGSTRNSFLSSPYVWLVLALTLDAIMVWKARRSFYRYFRVIAANQSNWKVAVGEAKAQARQKAAEDLASDRNHPTMSAGVSRPPRRALRWIVVIGLLMVLGIPVVRHYVFRAQAEKRIRALREAGQPTSPAEWAASRPAITNGLDTAALLEQAKANLYLLYRLPLAKQKLLPGFWIPGPGAMPDPKQPIPPPVKEAMLAAVSSNQMVLSLVSRAASLRHGRYALPETSAGKTQIQAFPTVCDLLAYQVYLAADNDDFTGAIESLGRLLDLLQSAENAIGFHYWRVTQLTGTLSLMEWLINRGVLNEAQLTRLQQQVDQLNPGADFELALQALQCNGCEWYRTWPSTPMVAGTAGKGFKPELIRHRLQFLVRDLTTATSREFIDYMDAISALRGKQPWKHRLQGPLEFLAANPLTMPPLNRISPFQRRHLYEFTLLPYAHLDATRGAMLAVLAIERYRLQNNGRRPRYLREAVLLAGVMDGFLDSRPRLPTDPFTGEWLKYAPLGSGYQVYSFGVNRQDNGGKTQAQIYGQLWNRNGGRPEEAAVFIDR